MNRLVHLAAWFPVVALLACGESATGPTSRASEDLFLLNSTGQTLAALSILDEISKAGEPVDLGAGFDGDAFDLTSEYAVTTVSSFGGSRILFVDLQAGSVLAAGFPEPETDRANPSAPSIELDGTVWVGGRGSDAVYRVRPGDSFAERVAADVGTFIERVVPVGQDLYVIDANLDDDGGTYLPRGAGRIVVLSRSGARKATISLPAPAVNPTDAIETEGRLIVLAAGSFDQQTFLPAGDGALVSIDLASGTASAPAALESNGVSVELGADGRLYVTTTTDYLTLELLRFDPITGTFDRGPSNPLVVRDAAGHRVDCWSATALRDGRIVCSTFSFERPGRIVLADGDGSFLDEAEGGYGTTDLALAPLR